MSSSSKDELTNLKHKIPVLVSNNFPAWDAKLGDYFYARGWDAFLQDTKWTAAADNGKERREAWNIITGTINDGMRVRMKAKRGQVEKAYKEIKDTYISPTMNTKESLKDAFEAIRLEHYQNFDDFIAEFEHIVKLMEQLGKVVDDDDKRYRLLKAVPHDYEATVTALKVHKVGQQPPGYEDCKASLRVRAEHPNVVGTVAFKTVGVSTVLNKAKKHNLKQALNAEEDNASDKDDKEKRSEKSKQICRHHLRGKCSWGDKCKFRHVEKPEQRKYCKYCAKKDHDMDKCELLKKDIEEAKKRAKDKADNTAEANFAQGYDSSDDNAYTVEECTAVVPRRLPPIEHGGCF